MGGGGATGRRKEIVNSKSKALLEGVGTGPREGTAVTNNENWERRRGGGFPSELLGETVGNENTTERAPAPVKEKKGTGSRDLEKLGFIGVKRLVVCGSGRKGERSVVGVRGEIPVFHRGGPPHPPHKKEELQKKGVPTKWGWQFE